MGTDPGWLRTFEEYYLSDVSHIITSITNALDGNPTRRFGWVEVSYLERWWRDQSSDMRTKLVSTQQHIRACPPPLGLRLPRD